MSDVASAPTMTTPRRRIFGWALWDWGTSGFSVIITTFVFPVFIVSSGFINDSGYPASDAELSSGFQWTFVVAGVIVAVLAPVLGRQADASGHVRRWLMLNTIVVAVATAAMVFIQPSATFWMLGLALYVIANVFYEFAFVNYNTVLVRITTPKNMGRVSGFGWGMGYVGGIILLLIVLLGFIGLSDSLPNLLGLPTDEAFNVRLAFLFTGFWALIFAIPVFVIAPRKPIGSTPERANIFAAYGKLFRDIGLLWREDRTTFAFLVASAIFRDGLAAVFTLGAVIAATVFEFSFTSIMYFGILANLVAGIGVFLSGWIEDKIGPKKVILGSLLGLMIAGLYVFAMRDAGAITFWIGGLLLSLFVGPTQSSSRTFLGRLTTPGREGELYGLYATTGRGLSWLTGLLFALFVVWFGGDAYGILAIVLVLLVGFLLTLPLKPRFDREHSAIEG